MQTNLRIKKGLEIRAYLLFFIIFGIQTGVGILRLPRLIFEQSKQDAWVSILIAFVYMMIVLTIMLIILNQYENADIFGIQVDLFGKWIGKFFGTIYIIFFLAEFLTVLLNYIEVVQVFIFPTMSSFMIGLIMMVLVIYCVLGGIRAVVGTVFIFTFLSPWVFGLLYDPISRIETAHFLPMFDASIIELIKGARKTTLSFLGLEILFVIYPFIIDKENAKFPSYLAIFASTLVVLVTTLTSIGYYSPQDFDQMDWAVLSLFKSVSFTFIERFDYLVIAEWMMFTIPILVLFMWAITHGTKRLYNIRQKTTLYSTSIIILLCISFIKKEDDIEIISEVIYNNGFWITFVYPFLLLPFLFFKKIKRKQKKE